MNLRYCSDNLEMFNLISKAIGGRVRIVKKNEFVIWVVDDRKSIQKILKIFDTYPPLTSRLRAQWKYIRLRPKSKTQF